MVLEAGQASGEYPVSVPGNRQQLPFSLERHQPRHLPEREPAGVPAGECDDSNIWRLSLSGPGWPLVPQLGSLPPHGMNQAPQYSPDGKQIAFESDRSGVMASGSAMRTAPTSWTCFSCGCGFWNRALVA